MPRDQVFISYSHKDKKWRDELESISSHISAMAPSKVGQTNKLLRVHNGSTEIESALTNSKIAVLLVSPDFLASDFIHEHELGPLLKKADQGGVKILWVPIRYSAYKQTPLNNYQAIIDPISHWLA